MGWPFTSCCTWRDSGKTCLGHLSLPKHHSSQDCLKFLPTSPSRQFSSPASLFPYHPLPLAKLLPAPHTLQACCYDYHLLHKPVLVAFLQQAVSLFSFSPDVESPHRTLSRENKTWWVSRGTGGSLERLVVEAGAEATVSLSVPVAELSCISDGAVEGL